MKKNKRKNMVQKKEASHDDDDTYDERKERETEIGQDRKSKRKRVQNERTGSMVFV